MTRWLVTYDDGVHSADTPGEALEEAAATGDFPIGATVYVVDLDAIEGTDRCHRMRIGAIAVEVAA